MMRAHEINFNGRIFKRRETELIESIWMRDTILDSNPIMVGQEDIPVDMNRRPRTSTEERIVQKPVGIRVTDV